MSIHVGRGITRQGKAWLLRSRVKQHVDQVDGFSIILVFLSRSSLYFINLYNFYYYVYSLKVMSNSFTKVQKKRLKIHKK